MKQKMLAVWIWPDTIARESPEAVVSRLSRAGVTDLYLLTKGQAGSACFDACKTAYKLAYRGRDILPSTLREAHQRGMRVHAWITASYDAAYKARFPEQGLYHFTRGRDSDVLNLASPEYLAFMKGFVRELFETCAPDGLHLDYIRYGHVTRGWGAEDIEALTARGADVEHLKSLMNKTYYDEGHDDRAIFDAYEAGDRDTQILAEYRRENVAHFAGALIDAARSVKPDAVMSAALMPEGAYVKGDRTQGVSAVAFAALHYGQSYPDAARLYDHVALMTYAPEYHQDGAWVKRLTKNAIEAYGCRAVAGLQSFDIGTTKTLNQEYSAVNELDGHKDFFGCALFRAGETAFCLERHHDGLCDLRLENALPRKITRVVLTPAESGCELGFARGGEWVRAGNEGVVIEGDELIPPFGTLDIQLRLSAPSPVLAQVFCGREEARALTVEAQESIGGIKP